MNIIKKKKIRSVSFVVILSLIISFNFVNIVNAETCSENEILISQTISNEYDVYKDFISKSDKKLINEGFSEEKIKEIKNVDYKKLIKEKVYKLEKFDNKVLEDMGYTKDKIKDIKNFSGTDVQIYSLSASLTLSTYNISHSKSSSYSQATFTTYWNWSSCPIFLFDDIIAVPWSEGMYLDIESSYTYAYREYYDEWTNTYVSMANLSIHPNLNTGAYVKFDMGYHNNDMGGLYVKKGKFGYKLYRLGRVKQLAVQPTYGHTTTGIGSPTVSFPGGLSVTFSNHTEEETYNYCPVTM